MKVLTIPSWKLVFFHLARSLSPIPSRSNLSTSRDKRPKVMNSTDSRPLTLSSRTLTMPCMSREFRILRADLSLAPSTLLLPITELTSMVHPLPGMFTLTMSLRLILLDSPRQALSSLVLTHTLLNTAMVEPQPIMPPGVKAAVFSPLLSKLELLTAQPI